MPNHKSTDQRTGNWSSAINDTFAFIGVVVTSATPIVYGSTIWDPVQLAGKFDNKLLVSFAMLAVIISTLATNIAANIVSPANDFANLSPNKINFKTGGYITGIIGILIFLEISCRSQWLYFYLAGGLLQFAGPSRRNPDC